MNKIQKRRLYYVSFFIVGIAITACLIFYALRQNMNVFVTPSELATMHVASDYHIRLGGMVKKDSLKRDNHSLALRFIVTDFKNDITVDYMGVLPDLFREGKGVVAEGTLNQDGTFEATQILAKHDENYTSRQMLKGVRR